MSSVRNRTNDFQLVGLLVPLHRIEGSKKITFVWQNLFTKYLPISAKVFLPDYDYRCSGENINCNRIIPHNQRAIGSRMVTTVPTGLLLVIVRVPL